MSEPFADFLARVDERAGRVNGGAPATSAAPMKVGFDAKGKMTLPAVPAHDDTAGQCAWLTCVLNLDTHRPIVRGEWQGLRGPDGHVALHRAQARPIRFEPVSRINNPQRLIESVGWQGEQSDGMLHAYKGEHCRPIAYVISCLADSAATASAEDEAAGIVTTFLLAAEVVEGLTTYGHHGAAVRGCAGHASPA